MDKNIIELNIYSYFLLVISKFTVGSVLSMILTPVNILCLIRAKLCSITVATEGLI
jgi:hypothetical protein